jgi:hypothetical protein
MGEDRQERSLLDRKVGQLHEFVALEPGSRLVNVVK